MATFLSGFLIWGVRLCLGVGWSRGVWLAVKLMKFFSPFAKTARRQVRAVYEVHDLFLIALR